MQFDEKMGGVSLGPTGGDVIAELQLTFGPTSTGSVQLSFDRALTEVANQGGTIALSARDSTLQLVDGTVTLSSVTAEQLLPSTPRLSGTATALSSWRLSLRPAGVPASVDPRVSDEIRRTGQARVIINLWEPGPLLAPYSERAAAVRQVQQRVLDTLRPSTIEIHHRYTTLAALGATITQQALEDLLHSPLVSNITPDLVGGASLLQAVPLLHGQQGRSAVASSQYRIPPFSSYSPLVAILDSGVDGTHPALQDSIFRQACFVTVEPAPPACPAPPVTDNALPGHGTGVAGVITSNGTPDFPSWLGFDPDAPLVVGKVVASDGHVQLSDLVDGLQWLYDSIATGDFTVRVVNMSLGFQHCIGQNCNRYTSCDGAAASCPQGEACELAPLENAINQLRAQGVILIASSGNDADGVGIRAPACFSSVLGVAATYDASLGSVTFTHNGVPVCTDQTTAAHQITCYSNTNSLLDLTAPGSYITSMGVTVTPPYGIVRWEGTSFSSPAVAGIASLMFRARPQMSTCEAESILPRDGGFKVTDPRNGLQFTAADALTAVNATLTLRGDANDSGSVDRQGTDRDYLVDYLFSGGPAPRTFIEGNANHDCLITVADVFYLNNYVNGGPPPQP